MGRNRAIIHDHCEFWSESMPLFTGRFPSHMSNDTIRFKAALRQWWSAMKCENTSPLIINIKKLIRSLTYRGIVQCLIIVIYHSKTMKKKYFYTTSQHHISKIQKHSDLICSTLHLPLEMERVRRMYMQFTAGPAGSGQGKCWLQQVYFKKLGEWFSKLFCFPAFSTMTL